jgi:RNA polymerase sigma-70 factor (ECF subfamily)
MSRPSVIPTADQRLVEELYPRLRRFAAAAAPWDLDPDDLLQDALTRTLATGSLARLEHPAAYLRKTMLNLASSHNRRGAINRRAMATVAASSQSGVSDDYPSDLSILTALSPRARAILYLASVEGYRYDEIGELVGCTSTAARMSAMRARRQLRRAMTEPRT